MERKPGDLNVRTAIRRIYDECRFFLDRITFTVTGTLAVSAANEKYVHVYGSVNTVHDL